MKFRHLQLLILSLALALSAASQSSAEQSPEVSAAADRIMSGIMSPYCPGRLLRDCPSGQALQLKEKIVSRLAAGESEQLVVDDLIATFGEEMRASPKASGFGLVAWLAPALFLFLGGTLTLLWLRNRSIEPETSPPAAPLDTDSEERLAHLIGKP